MIIDSDTFCIEVEKLHAHHGMSMFESIFLICERYNIDFEYVGPLVNRSIKEKLECEAIQKNLMKSTQHTLFDDDDVET
jgi:hypothetical protein